MDFDEIPDDIWIEIFERVDDPYPLAVLMRTCQRFRELARKPLLREIRWMKPGSTRRNIEAWNGVYRGVHIFPRKLTVGVPFELTSRAYATTTITNETRLHDAIWGHLPLFTSLNELVLDETTISLYSYTVFAQMPALRSLSLLNCTYVRLPVSFQEHSEHDPFKHKNNLSLFPTSFPFSTLPITHLSIHKVNGQFDSDGFHPVNLIAAANLSSLSITWTGSIAQAHAFNSPPLPNLAELDVTMPILTRDLVDSLLNFVGGCALAPRIQLAIERHNLSDQQIGAVQVPLRNVWNYQGPLPIASFGMSRQMIRQGANASLTHVVMNDPLDLGSLLDGLERLPNGIETLEIQVRRWDIELLFAIRELFPKISSLVIRYGRGNFPADFFVTLGANILFDLPKLVTLKLFHDTSCILSSRQINNAHHFGTYHFAAQPLFLNFEMGDDQHEQDNNEASSSEEASSSSSGGGLLGFEHADLKDYLIGWNRYCKRLRHVQLSENTWWERKFEGDVWREVSNEEEN